MEQPKLQRARDAVRDPSRGDVGSRAPARPNALDARMLEQISASYEIADAEVVPYLQETPFLAEILVDAEAALRRYFPSATLSLEVDHDPGAENDRQLALVVTSTLSPDEATDRLRRFDVEWWLDRQPSAEDRLFITLSFE